MDHVRALEQRVEKLSAKNVVLETKLNATPTLPAGALLTFADGRTVCPEGTAEPNITQGMMLVGRPKNGKTGAVFNRPFDAGEIGRTPTHSHAVSVNDAGHTHVGIVNDPGHEHSTSLHNFATTAQGTPGGTVGTWPVGQLIGLPSNVSKTGITVDNLPAKSSIEVSIDANDAGEHYPLVYVLLCQKLP